MNVIQACGWYSVPDSDELDATSSVNSLELCFAVCHVVGEALMLSFLSKVDKGFASTMRHCSEGA
jgi:hypothetical protein